MIIRLLEGLSAAPALVVATSLTAGVVIRLAIARPICFRGYFWCLPLAIATLAVTIKPAYRLCLAGTPGLDRLIYQLGAANELAVQSFLTNFLFANPSRITPDIVQAYTACTQQPNAEYAALSSLNGDISFDLSRFIGQLNVPTTVVVGEKSRFLPPAVVKRLAGLNPKAVQQVWEVPDSGVLPHLEQSGSCGGFAAAVAGREQKQ